MLQLHNDQFGIAAMQHTHGRRNCAFCARLGKSWDAHWYFSNQPNPLGRYLGLESNNCGNYPPHLPNYLGKHGTFLPKADLSISCGVLDKIVYMLCFVTCLRKDASKLDRHVSCECPSIPKKSLDFHEFPCDPCSHDEDGLAKGQQDPE